MILVVCLRSWEQMANVGLESLQWSMAEEVYCRGWMINGRGVKGNGWEATLSSALQNFNGRIDVLLKANPKQPPKRDVSGMGPTGKQGVKLDQEKCVPSSINAPANTQSWLMRKDVWTV